MNITITWWMIPTLILVLGLIWALFIVEGDGYLAGIANIFAIIPVLGVSLVAFIIAGALK